MVPARYSRQANWLEKFGVKLDFPNWENLKLDSQRNPALTGILLLNLTSWKVFNVKRYALDINSSCLSVIWSSLTGN